MSPCRVHPGAPRTCRGDKPARAPHLRYRNGTKTPYATCGAHGITYATTRLSREAPLTGVLALATDPVNVDRSPLSEGHPE